MKLFILNKEKLDSAFCYQDEHSKTIHQRAFNQLKKSIEAYKSIPLFLKPDLDVDSIAVFEFVSVDKKKNVYFYEFNGIAL
jgi:hypothetical protein